MITSLRAQNFKSWRDTGDLRLAPLTGLFGTNSSGKSSILQVLLMMKQTAEHPDSQRVLKLGKDFLGDERVYVDLRSFTEAIHDHDSSLELGLDLSWVAKDHFRSPEFRGAGGAQVQTKIAELKVDREQVMFVRSFLYTANENQFGVLRSSDLNYHLLNPKNAPVSMRGDAILPRPERFYGFPEEILREHDDMRFLTELPISFEACLRSIRYLGPLRTEPAASYTWSGSPPVDVGRQGEYAVQALLAARGTEPRVERQVAEWLAKLGLIASIHLSRLSERRDYYEVRVKQTPAGSEVLLPDVGFGVSQILPVLVLCAYAQEGSILLLEQPEMHLHPSAQSELADVIIEAVIKRKLQIIVESHSEHFLRRLQMRIAKEEFSAKDAALYFCHIENGESKAELLRLTDDGYVKNWPPNFFGDEMGDIVAMTEASIGRRRRTK